MIRASSRSQFQDDASLPGAERFGEAQHGPPASRFVDMTTNEVSRLNAFDETSHAGGSEVASWGCFIERCLQWRAVTDKDKRAKFRERIQSVA